MRSTLGGSIPPSFIIRRAFDTAPYAKPQNGFFARERPHRSTNSIRFGRGAARPVE